MSGLLFDHYDRFGLPVTCAYVNESIDIMRRQLEEADRDRAQREELRKAEVKRLREQLDFSDSIRAQRDELREKNRQANALIKELRAELASIRAMGVLTPDDPSLPPDMDAELAAHTARDLATTDPEPTPAEGTHLCGAFKLDYGLGYDEWAPTDSGCPRCRAYAGAPAELAGEDVER